MGLMMPVSLDQHPGVDEGSNDKGRGFQNQEDSDARYVTTWAFIDIATMFLGYRDCLYVATHQVFPAMSWKPAWRS